MRLALSLLAVSVSLIAISPAMSGEQGNPIESQSKQHFTVSCRWSERHDGVDSVACRTLTVIDGEKGSIVDTTETPVVTKGMKIDVMVKGRQPDGATVQVELEKSELTTVDTITYSTIETKCVSDFVKFGKALIVPIGEKLADGTIPHLEIVVSVRTPSQPKK
jgi:hypothetical protein